MKASFIYVRLHVSLTSGDQEVGDQHGREDGHGRRHGYGELSHFDVGRHEYVEGQIVQRFKHFADLNSVIINSSRIAGVGGCFFLFC